MVNLVSYCCCLPDVSHTGGYQHPETWIDDEDKTEEQDRQEDRDCNGPIFLRQEVQSSKLQIVVRNYCPDQVEEKRGVGEEPENKSINCSAWSWCWTVFSRIASVGFVPLHLETNILSAIFWGLFNKHFCISLCF